MQQGVHARRCFVEAHKRAFEIADDRPALRVFEAAVDDLDECFIDCSCAVVDDRIHPCRFNLHYLPEVTAAETLDTARAFLRRVDAHASVTLDLEPFERLFGARDFDLRQASRMMTGVDLRPWLGDSRVKVQADLARYDAKLEVGLQLAGVAGERAFRPLVERARSRYVGFTFRFDGQTDVEVYVSVDADAYPLLGGLLPDSALRVLEKDARLVLGLSRSNRRVIAVYYLLLDHRALFDLVPAGESVRRIHEHYLGRGLVDSVSLKIEPDALERGGPLTTASLYYSARFGRLDPAEGSWR